MSVSQHSKFERDEQLAAGIASIVAAVVGGLFLFLVGGPVEFGKLAGAVGSASPRTGWAVWLSAGLVFGVVFAVVMSRTINTFTNTVIMVSRKSRVTQKLLVPLLHRSALGLTAGSMGLVYGQVLAFGVYAYLVPIVYAVQGEPVPNYPLANFLVIFAILVYAQLLGAIYGILLESPWFTPGETADEQNAALVGALGGGVVGSAVLYLVGGRPALVALGSVAGGTTALAGVGVFLATAVVFGLLFVPVVSRTINDFTATVIMFSQRSEATRRVLVPLVSRAALTVTAGSMGLVYGLGLGVAFAVLAAVGAPLPQLGLAGVLSFAAFGATLGNGYGMVMESFEPGTFRPSEEQRAGVVASLAAGLLTGLFLLVVVGFGVFEQFAALAGRAGFVRGFLVWMALAVGFGLLFVVVLARTVNGFTSTVILLSQRSSATQKLLVPLLRRAALTVTAGSMGLVYGLVLGIGFYGLVLPVLLGLAGVPAPLPQFDPLVLVAFAVYGQVLGTNYGLQLEDADLSPPSLPFLGGSETASESRDETDEEGTETAVERSAFGRWRAQRPFAGGALLVLAGLIIGSIPMRLQSIFPGPSKTALGLVFASMVIACGVFALIKPELSTLVGVTGIAMSILSLIGAFGGLIVGMLVGIVGGNLCIAWQDPEADEESGRDSRFRWIGDGERGQW